MPNFFKNQPDVEQLNQRGFKELAKDFSLDLFWVLFLSPF